jgi:ferritin-like metal-binding protein YciE
MKLKDIYWAEKKAAASPELQNALEEHYAQTQTHVERLEKIFASLEKKPQAKNVMPWQVFLRKERAL